MQGIIEEAKDIRTDCMLLYFYDWVLTVNQSISPTDQETKDKMVYWAGFMFRTWHSKGTQSSTFEDAKGGLLKFNKYLALRSFVIGHSLSTADVIVVSAIRQNNEIWSGLTDNKFLGFENIKRWYDWIEGIAQISWNQINSKNNKLKDKKSKKTRVKFARSNELLAAVKAKNIGKAREILEESPNSVTTCDTEKKKSLAHIAWENEDLEMLKLLVESKIDLESMTSSGKSVIYYAVDRKNTDIVKFLIDQKVNLEHSGHQNRTPLYMAALKGNLETVKLLIEAGSNPDAYSRFKKTAITKACWDGYSDIVECLLQTGKIDVNLGDYKGLTALHNAVWGRIRGRSGEKENSPSQGSYECAKLLLEHGADPNAKDETGNTPLHTAWATNGVNCIKLLISYGAEINSKNNHGATPLLSACLKGYYECCKVLYEYDELEPFITTNNGYCAFEYAIEDRKGRIIRWIIEEKLNNNKEYPGLEIDSFDSTKMLHIAVHNPNTPHKSLSHLLDYYWNKDPCLVTDWFLDVLNRAILKKSALGVQALIDFYIEKDLSRKLKFNEVLLEVGIHFEDEKIFELIAQNYEGGLPQIALQTTVFLQKEAFLTILLKTFSEQFKSPDSYKEISEIPQEFTKNIDNDILINNTYFEKISHPIFSDADKSRSFIKYNPLQLAVYLINSRMVKLILNSTCYKASTLLKNGDNIIHLIVSQKFGDAFILQKLLQRLELEVGGKENVKKDFLLTKSDSDGLTTLEYWAGNKFYAPILYQYSSAIGASEDDLNSDSTVLDVEFISELTLEEEEKLDKKASALEIKQEAKIKHKELINQTEQLSKQDQFVFNFAKEIGLDLSGRRDDNSLDISFLGNIPKLKDKPCKFINDLEELKICADEMKKHKVLGVDLEFTGNKRICIASLIQISSIEWDYVVDALVLREKVGPILSPVFGDPSIVKVFHGWDYDIQLLLTDLEISILNVFDTARALRWMMKVSSGTDPQFVSFEYLITSFLGVKTNKYFQVAEWRLRPLPKVMMNYCRADSHYLLFVYAVMMDFMKDSDNKVAVSGQTYEENKAWIDKRREDKHKWVGVIEDLKEVMWKFMIQRIEKAGPRNYQVIIHEHH
jgi:ankyrin repeat protein